MEIGRFFDSIQYMAAIKVIDKKWVGKLTSHSRSLIRPMRMNKILSFITYYLLPITYYLKTWYMVICAHKSILYAVAAASCLADPCVPS